MEKYNLEQNESVIMKSEHVYHCKKNGELVLSNLNLFFVYAKGTLKKHISPNSTQ